MPKAASGGVAAVIVLYRPDTAVPENVAAIAGQVDRTFLIDNTEIPEPSMFERMCTLGDVEYVPMGGNTGVAAALNVGLEHVDAAGYEWALTLDQDSAPPPGLVSRLLSCARLCASRGRVGVIAPLHHVEGAPAPERFEGCRDELTVITSGDLLSVAAWREVGGFDESLFIDGVDHDLCLRMHSEGRIVASCGTALLPHRMGDMVRRWLLRPLYVSNHAPVRRYYITRNRLDLIARYRRSYPEYVSRERRAMWREFAKMVLFETRRIEKLHMMWLGWRDHALGVSGPFGHADRTGARSATSSD